MKFDKSFTLGITMVTAIMSVASFAVIKHQVDLTSDKGLTAYAYADAVDTISKESMTPDIDSSTDLTIEDYSTVETVASTIILEEALIYNESESEAETDSELTIIPSYSEPIVFNPTTYQVNKSYNIPAEFYYAILPEDMHCLVESVCELEQTQEISSMFLIAVAATEVGWHGSVVGKNNWYNWTPDAKHYQDFDSPRDCVMYTGKRFQECFFNPEWYAIKGQTVDEYFTIDEINSRYAFYDDCTVNWYWGEVVSDILGSLNRKYAKWVNENYD